MMRPTESGDLFDTEHECNGRDLLDLLGIQGTFLIVSH